MCIRCTLCQSLDIEKIDTNIRNVSDENIKMYKCLACGTHFMYPIPSEGELESYYDGKFREEVHTESYYSKEILKRTFDNFYGEALQRVERVKGDLRSDDKVLEIGCSVGYFLDAVSPHVAMACGTEWDSRARKFVSDELNGEKIRAKKDPADFGMKFDKIFMFHVLEHIEKPAEYLKGLRPLLNENGRIYIEVPNVDDAMVSLYKCRSFMNFYYKKAHIYNFCEKSIEYVLEKAGYKDYKVDFIQRYDISNHLAWLATGAPTGRAGIYKDVFGLKVNAEYVEALIKSKKSDTLFITVNA